MEMVFHDKYCMYRFILDVSRLIRKRMLPAWKMDANAGVFSSIDKFHGKLKYEKVEGQILN